MSSSTLPKPQSSAAPVRLPIRHRILPKLRAQYASKSETERSVVKSVVKSAVRSAVTSPSISVGPNHDVNTNTLDDGIKDCEKTAPATATDTATATGSATDPVEKRQQITVKKKKQISSVPWEVPAVLPHRPWIVASFDIGVKTLSYSVLSFDHESTTGKEYQIYDWDIIDLMPSKTKNLVCGYPLNTGKRKGQPCGKKASYSYSSTAGSQSSESENTDAEKDLDDSSELKGLCKVHYKKIPGTSPIRERLVNNMTNLELNIQVVQELDKRPIFLEVDEILLEHQPSKNPRMKNLSYMLHSYFVLRGLVDGNKDNRESRLINVRFISPKNKLNVYDGPPVAKKYARPYDENKYRSKVYSEFLIRYDPTRLEYFKGSHKKRDDLGDAFLQGAWYLKKNYRKLNKRLNL